MRNIVTEDINTTARLASRFCAAERCVMFCLLRATAARIDPEERRCVWGAGNKLVVISFSPLALLTREIAVQLGLILELELRNWSPADANISKGSSEVPAKLTAVFESFAKETMPWCTPIVMLADSLFELVKQFRPSSPAVGSVGLGSSSASWEKSEVNFVISCWRSAPRRMTRLIVTPLGRMWSF